MPDVLTAVTPCPDCGSETRLKATVLAGRWERSFFECRACDLGFPGSWHEPDATADRKRVSASIVAPLALA